MAVGSPGWMFCWHKCRHLHCSMADLLGCDPMSAIKIMSIEQMGQSDAFAFMRHWIRFSATDHSYPKLMPSCFEWKWWKGGFLAAVDNFQTLTHQVASLVKCLFAWKESKALRHSQFLCWIYNSIFKPFERCLVSKKPFGGRIKTVLYSAAVCRVWLGTPPQRHCTYI